MNDATDPQQPDGPDGPDGPGEPVGSVAEEAAKLFAALSGWAKEHGSDYAASASGAATAMSAAMNDLGDHVATGGEDCRYCPVCQVIHAVRQTSPEVRAHLAVAASSLMQAAAGIMATQVPRERPGPLQRIDLDDPDGWDEDADA